MRHSRVHVTNPRYRVTVLSIVTILLTAAGSQAAPMPDLIVTDFWEQKGTISFTLENSGTKAAPAGHTAYLSVDGHDVDTAYIAVTIAEGKTYTATFNKYSWECTASGQHTLAVRADATDKVAESNEKNNSRQEVWTCDVTTPVITLGPSVMYITQTSAKVSWTTDEDSDSVVRYGLSHGVYTWTESSAPLTTDHKIFLDGLTPDTLYYFVVESTDDAGNTVRSKEYTFRTEAPPKLPDLVVTEIWEQNHQIHCRVKNSGEGPADPGHRAGLSLDGHLVDTASVLVELAPGASVELSFPKFYFVCSAPKYMLRVAADLDNSIAESNEINNAMEKVVVCDVVAPKILSGPLVEDIATTSATIRWTTDEDSDSVVRYGQLPNQYTQTKASGQMTTDHEVSLDGLQLGTHYYFVVESADAAGNTVRSKEKSFQTEFDQPDRPDLITADLWEQDHLIYFRIQNIGRGAAEAGHRAGLYVADRLIDTAGIAQGLAPGDSTEGHFEKFYFRCFDAQHTLRIVADIDDEIAEADENNNTLDKTLVCDVAPLRIVSGPSAQEIGTKSAAIVWGTNKTSNGEVLYDSHADTFGQKAEDQTPTTKHRVSLTNLSPGTAYQFQVRSIDASGQSATSRPGYFQTLSKTDTQPPRIADMTIVRRETKFPSYRMEASATDDTGVDKVEFLVDGQLIYTDYSPPYDAVFAPGMISEILGEFFRPHPVEAIASDGGRMQGSRAGMFDPPYECNEVSAEFEWPFPNEKIYIPGETAPPGTEVPIQVYAVTWDMTCRSIGSIEAPPGSSAAEMGMVCDTDEVAVRKVTFFVNGVEIGTVPSQPNHTYAMTWDAGGYPLGAHVIRADVTANDECIETITQQVQIEQGGYELDLTRRVWREENAFRIELTIRNRGTLDYACDMIRDNLIGLYAVPETYSHYAVIPRAATGTGDCDVDINVFGEGESTQLIRAGRSFAVEYHAIPVLTSAYPFWADYPIGRDPVEITSSGGAGRWTFNRRCVRTEDGILLTDELDAAVQTADFLIVTNSDNCQSEFGSADAVLGQMATLAYYRNGVLGCLDNWIPSGLAPPSAASIRDQICTWGAAMASGYLSNGYLLLVGETEILPAWTIDVGSIEWSNADPTTEVPLSDLPYADVSGADNVPELIVGRIIGNDDGLLIQAMQASLDGGFDRSFGVATSGAEADWENFVGNAYRIFSTWTDQGAAGEIMTGDHLLHHWSAYVQKEQLVSGHDFPMDPGDGSVTGALAGTGTSVIRIDPDTDTAYVATAGDLDLIHTAFTTEFACPFDSGDALAAGDIDADGEEEIIVGSIARDRIIIACDPPNTTARTYLEFAADLEPWDVIACGRLFDFMASEQVVVARPADGGTVDIYEYVSSPAGLYRTWQLDIPFTAYDGLAIADVNGANPGDEIIIGSDDDSRIHIYSRTGNLIASIPGDPYTAYDSLVAGDLDGDGLDEFAVLIDDTVDSKRRLKTFQSDCWFLDPNDEWQIKDHTTQTIYSRFLHFDGARTTGGSTGRDSVACHDLDGDGKDEICIARESDDRLYVIDGHYSRGWKDRYMPVLQNVDDEIDVFALSGHGNPGACSPFNTDDIRTLNLAAHPVVFALSCLTGNYEGAGDNGFAETFLAQGAGVYIGSTEVSASSSNEAAGPAFFSRWDTSASVGEAFRDYRRTCASSGDSMWRYWAMEYNYYGDPKFGGGDAAVAAAGARAGLAIAAEPVLPGLGESIIVPDYQVETADGKDHVTIPGGEMKIEAGKPMVPCYRGQWDLPPGTVVQEVRLQQRSGLTSSIGLLLPTAVLRVDADGADLRAQAEPEPTWYPAKDLDWRLVPNSDGSTTLVVLLYPFFYNSFTTETRFYPQFVIDVEIASPDIRVVSLFTDKPVYKAGDPVTINLLLNGSGQAQDVFVDAAIRRYGSDDLVAGLLLRRLSALMGPASFSPTWDSQGASPGSYYADVTVADPAGTVLGRAKYLFELNAPTTQTGP